jgi:pyroglutamyl-peptidase
VKKSAQPVLLTGFEPFDGATVNPSAEIVRRMHGRKLGRHAIAGIVLPCRFGEAMTVLKREIRRLDPALVVCLGQAGGRAEITPERIAINVDDARIPDNAGKQPVDRPIVQHGPAAYWSTLPIKAIVAALQARNIPAAVSQTAGTFVCNHVFYGLMHALRRRRGVRGGFVHLPWLPEQAGPGQPSLALEVMLRAIEVTLRVALRRKQDLRAAGGRTH